MHRQLLQSQARKILEVFAQMTPEERDAVIRYAHRVRSLTDSTPPALPSAVVLQLTAREAPLQA